MAIQVEQERAAEAAAEPRARLTHRPLLDVLRGIAVLSVLAYHGGFFWSAGGFLGIDLFFALSGFLIMSILLRQREDLGKVDLAGFWAARARRLLPALGLVIVLILWVLPMLGAQWPGRTSGDAMATAAYVANWWYIASGQNYADADSGPSPLLHTWSLSVEEQWYVVLPLLLLLAGSLKASRRLILIAACVLAGLSALWMVALYPGSGDPSRVYMGTDTRVQALLIGAIGAIAARSWRERGGGHSNSRLMPALLVGGLVGYLAFFAISRLEAAWLYSGGFTIIALVCAALVVGAAESAPAVPEGIQRALLRPLAWVGLISYSLYLFHWPIFLFIDQKLPDLAGGPQFALKLAASFAAAAASYYVIEQPIRTRRWRSWGSGLAAPWLTAAGCVCLVGAILYPIAPAPASDSLTNLEEIAAQQQAQAGTSAKPKPPTAAASTTVLLVGDSQALSVFAAARDDPGTGWDLRVATRFGCGVVPYDAYADGTELNPQSPLCAEWERARESEIAGAGAQVAVLFAGAWEQYDRLVGGNPITFTDPEWMKLTTADYAKVLGEMSRHTSQLAVALNHCHRAPEVAASVSTLYQWGRYPPVVNDQKRVEATNEALRAAAAQFPDVKILDTDEFLCPNGFTDSLQGQKLRTDGMHFTTEAGRMVWDWMRGQLAPREPQP